MKFYLIETITFNTGAKDSVAIYAKDTEREAIAAAHKELGSWMVNHDVQCINVIVKNERGFIYLNESDAKPAEETIGV